MAQQIINGFPQHFQTSYLKSKFTGTLATQTAQVQTDLNLIVDTTGDVINVDAPTLGLLQVSRDGALLIEGEGFTLLSPSNIRLTPGLLEGETVEFSFLKGN